MSRLPAALLLLLLLAACGDELPPGAHDAAVPDGAPDADLAGPHMVVELKPGGGDEGSSFPSFLTPLGERVCFVAFPVAIGPGILACSDGTDTGTTTVRDFDYYPHAVVGLDDRLVMLAADDGQIGLWVSDGTAAGTTLLVETPGASAGSFDVGARVGDVALMHARAEGKTTMWASDGTAAGTVALRVFQGEFATPIASDGARAFFFVGGNVLTDRGLWVSDGTPGGTRRVSFIPAGEDLAGTQPAIAAGGHVYYLLSDELWRSDGVSGADKLITIPAGRFAGGLTTFGADAYFRTTDGQGGAAELWRSDGTAMGTALFRTGEVSWLASFGGALLFLGEGTLRATDGTAMGTVDVAGPLFDGGFQQAWTTAGLVFFTAGDGEHGPEPWITDGSAAGTRLWHDLVPGPVGSQAFGFTAAGAQVFFVADDDVHGAELWVAPRP